MTAFYPPVSCHFINLEVHLQTASYLLMEIRDALAELQ